MEVRVVAEILEFRGRKESVTEKREKNQGFLREKQENGIWSMGEREKDDSP
jgi:hypothetical protein